MRHRHDGGVDDGGRPRYSGCREVLTIRPDDARGWLEVVFRGGAGRMVADGLLHAGAVVAADGRGLNLNEPGVVRALLDQARAHGWRIDEPHRTEVDGWTLFDAVVGRG
ncbi:hypothetical protein GCM10009682_15430 [Luedemannella flava]|uniref:Uncharacterized protein n=1 Tax=Luedemannella flava TaxID=349316 RepID=A0ABP4XY91_9ACTN